MQEGRPAHDTVGIHFQVAALTHSRLTSLPFDGCPTPLTLASITASKAMRQGVPPAVLLFLLWQPRAQPPSNSALQE